ncbi:PREDICTED: uncharacterized protein LOC105462472 [Wasmannia auropunctata]|uniref:uncharacterized protein LOC105462472 n=1 Tax=Wasmannia auropunctata TaxID=64793 RepID=UPI0005F0560E|nr:PREDICTED: uncharacterized protein LOC105462472 [Wasmannia auropunctata]
MKMDYSAIFSRSHCILGQNLEDIVAFLDKGKVRELLNSRDKIVQDRKAQEMRKLTTEANRSCYNKGIIWNGCHSFAGGCNNSNSTENFRPSLPPTPEISEYQQVSQYNSSNYQFSGPPCQNACQQSSNYDDSIATNRYNLPNYNSPLYNYGSPSDATNKCGINVPNSSDCFNLPSSPESPTTTPPKVTSPSTVARTNRAQAQPQRFACPQKRNVFVSGSSTTTFTTSPTSTNTRSIAATNAAPAATNVLYNEQLPSQNFRNKTEYRGGAEEQQHSCGGSTSSSRYNPSAYNVTPNTLKILSNVGGDNIFVDRNSFLTSLTAIPEVREEQQQEQLVSESSVIPRYRLNNAGIFPERGPTLKEESVINASIVGTIGVPNRSNFKQQSFCAGRSTGDASLVKQAALPQYIDTISPTSDIVTEMKYETQSGPPAAPPHLTSSGVEPPHSSQGSGIVLGSSPTEIDTLLMPGCWANGQDSFMEGGVTDAKQTAVAFQDNWDTLLGTTVSEQTLPDVKLLPLPPFTNYTGHLQINGIPGHHYHAIASSGQRSSIDVGSASPTPSSNQEFFESPVVSSSTPCPQASQKQQPQQQQQNHQHPQHHHPHNQQQQLPQSTQPINYEDMEDIAQIIGSAIADTTVPGNGNGPNSEQDTDASRDWIDIADWITTEAGCSPKTQETTSPSTFAPHQIYVTTTPPTQTQQHAGSALQNLLTQKLDYAPLLQARLQAGANANLHQNASCGETPSSTSPYPPLSPPNRVSTSCSPDDILHSSFAAPSHPRKRSRSSPGSGASPSKKGPTAGAAALPYGTESGLMSGKDKPIHRCHICQRGFLNKSNIKVHLRTHTGEKPFRCDVCNKAFRQKAHLIKHQQIHKRIGRD